MISPGSAPRRRAGQHMSFRDARVATSIDVIRNSSPADTKPERAPHAPALIRGTSPSNPPAVGPDRLSERSQEPPRPVRRSAPYAGSETGFSDSFRDATTWASPLWCCHFQKSTASDVRSRLHYSRFPRGRHRGNERSAYGGAGSVPLLWGPLLDDAGQDRGQPCEEPLVAIISQDGYGIGGSVDLVVGFRS